MTTAPPPLSIYQLRVVLRGISPLIWRRVLVHSETTLTHLHTILQILFAWNDEHLHSFHIHGKEYGSSGAPTRGVRLRDFCLHRGEWFRYVYDFGASWECEISLEALLPLAPRRVYPGKKRGQTPKKLDILMHRVLSFVVCINQPFTRKETMRTTITVDDQLLVQAKARAATLGVTLAQLIEDALRESLMRRENVEHRGRVRLITVPGTGTRPGIDLDNSHTLLEIMEQ